MGLSSIVRAMAYRSLPCGNDAAGSQHGPAQGSPAAHVHPVHFLDFALGQPIETVPDPQHDVTLVQAEADGCPGGGVHPGGGRTGIQHRDAEAFLPGDSRMGQGAHHRFQRIQGILEAGAAQAHGLFVISGGDRFGHCPGFFHAFHQREMGDVIGPRADHHGFILGLGFEQGLDGFVPQLGGQDAVIGARPTAALDMPKHGDAHFLAQAVLPAPAGHRYCRCSCHRGPGRLPP